MSHFGYSEKHQRRSVSPILKTTSEDRRVLHHNKENYIQYLEHQLEKTATMVNKKYEERMRGLEQIVQEHEEKFTNFVKLVKLLQNFAESQEQENGNIKKYINTTMEQLYHNELRTMNTSIHEIQHKIDQMQTFSFRESPALQEFEESVNRKIDIMMEEVKSSALKTDHQLLEQRLNKLESMKQTQQNIQNQDLPINVQQQLTELKVLLDNVLKEQEALKTSVQTIHFDLNQSKSAATLPQRPSRKSEQRESQQSEQESVMKPKIIQKNTEQTETKKKVKLSKSRSESKQNTEPKKKKKSIGQVKIKNVKSTSKLKH